MVAETLVDGTSQGIASLSPTGRACRRALVGTPPIYEPDFALVARGAGPEKDDYTPVPTPPVPMASRRFDSRGGRVPAQHLAL
jgi:hypothetical protein